MSMPILQFFYAIQRTRMRGLVRFLWLMHLMLFMLMLTGCDRIWNNPYPTSEATQNIKYTSFTGQPKTLDPARSYSTDEAIFTAQIYEPPLQYHYLKRPYTLVPLTATKMPTITCLDKQGKLLPPNAPSDQVAYSLYDIEIKPGIFYQPHPAFVKNAKGQYLYHALHPDDLKHIDRLSDFEKVATRELTADDYVYEIKRIAMPTVNSPVFGFMASKIVGLEDYARLMNQVIRSKKGFINLQQYPLVGAQVIDRYHYRITVKGNYPQFIYWLSMPFFGPVPWEADAFYAQPGMANENINFDWYPVGTGPYMLTENNPNRRMVLRRNPNFHREYFPAEGEPSDAAAGYLNNAGKRLPFIDEIVFTLEKESVPRWNKFLQGYYDQSTISSDSFDQAIQMDAKGNPYLTPDLQKMGLYLQTSITLTTSFVGFNMLDDVVGGRSNRARKLRQAISIAIDFEEYINIFLNGRGVPAQGPLPSGIFGYLAGKQGVNTYVYRWGNNQPIRRSINDAKQLLQEAGYARGIDPKTGSPLLLNYDVASTGGPEEKALLEWMRDQFAKIGIQLNIRTTDYNRFQEKIRLGQAQIYLWGWVADYPDPENFLFLLYGPNGKVRFGGENASNYENPQFDFLFNQMKAMPNNQERLRIIQDMLAIVRRDAPWIWGVNPKDFILNQSWVVPTKPNVIAYNTLKYQRVDPSKRELLRQRLNRAVWWPVLLGLFVLVVISLPVIIRYRQKERESIKRK